MADSSDEFTGQMIDKQFMHISAAVSGAVAVVLTLSSRVFSLFSDDMSTTGAIVLASLVVVLYAVLVLAIANRIKLNKMEGENP